MKKIGIIGGSGLDDPKILSNPKELAMDTPYGKTSDRLVCGAIGNTEVVILARHAKGHSISPTRVPYRANIWALKEAGCTELLATTACGSLREELMPGDLVFIDQFIDWTKLRTLTFFEDEVVHTAMPEPFDAALRAKLAAAAEALGYKYHGKGTMVTIEGPRFSTRAESNMFRLMGADLINMSTVPEVSLANELKLPYQSIAMVTDYDCWKENEEPVSYEMVLNRMRENAEKVKKLLIKMAE
ncbi:5'-methylthioadenosine phosphorylase [Sporobacter termitidis DSM 10068]|uniref:Purine nucleoside phosphorylase n=1 Tax=Sporobacter termitidis DSM 10068 TaxID=1123282 RepID=A0A1M5ZEB8_9FIRM|nr:S-methyl-5'-thioadenosine phosphorylase [Sporobacter termitidis]SHI22570.1 5'-methylthioadenosine phosphorylase [Sporobacter termitidis DSM 10068]